MKKILILISLTTLLTACGEDFKLPEKQIAEPTEVESLTSLGYSRDSIDMVKDVYELVLRRPADSRGLRAWVRQVESQGLDEDELIDIFYKSREAAALRVYVCTQVYGKNCTQRLVSFIGRHQRDDLRTDSRLFAPHVDTFSSSLSYWVKYFLGRDRSKLSNGDPSAATLETIKRYVLEIAQ